MSGEQNMVDPRHPHEPELEPVLDDEGRCLVCKALVAAQEEGFESGFRHAEAQPRWLLTGDLDWLEFAMADYMAKHLTNFTGRPYDGNTAGMPTAAANAAMTVIRKNVRRIEHPLGTPPGFKEG